MELNQVCILAKLKYLDRLNSFSEIESVILQDFRNLGLMDFLFEFNLKILGSCWKNNDIP